MYDTKIIDCVIADTKEELDEILRRKRKGLKKYIRVCAACGNTYETDVPAVKPIIIDGRKYYPSDMNFQAIWCPSCAKKIEDWSREKEPYQVIPFVK